MASARASKKKSTEALRTILSSKTEALTEADVDKIDGEMQEITERRQEATKKRSRPSKRSKHEIEEDLEDTKVIEAAQIAKEEAPNHLELPKHLYPEFTPALENARRRDETYIEQLRNRLNSYSEKLSVGATPDMVEQNLSLARTFFRENQPATPVIRDYNDSIVTIMNAAQNFIIETPEGFEPKQRVELVDIKLLPPLTDDGKPLYPNQCRRLDLSYVLTQTAQLRETIGDAEPVDKDIVEVVRVPLMLGSAYCYIDIDKVPRNERPKYDECPNDPYGYFIVDGKMRVLIGQEKLSIDLSILINRGAKHGGEFECSMLCMTPTKALANHTFYEMPIKKGSDQAQVMARIQNLTNPSTPSNLLSVLRVIKIVESSLFEVEEERRSSDLVGETLEENIAELTKSSNNRSLARDFRAYLATTFDKAFETTNDDTFIREFAKMHNLPLFKRKAIPPPKPKKKTTRVRTVAREEEPELAPEVVEEMETPDYHAVWNHVMNNLFPQVTIHTYIELFKARDQVTEIPDEQLDTYTALAAQAMQRAKEEMLIYSAFRLFLYRLSPATETDDRDHFGIKRVELEGTLTANFYLKELQKAKDSILRAYKETYKSKGATTLLEHVRRFFAVSTRAAGSMRGAVATKGSAQNITSVMHTFFTSEVYNTGVGYTTKGVSHLLETDSLASMISGIRKVTSKGDQAKRTILPHLYHASQGGLFCPFETPDDQNCLDVDEKVLMADSSYKRIGDLQDGDSVVTIDDRTGESLMTEIYNCFVKDLKPRERVYEVTTVSGRSIKATGDHPLLTQRGWIDVENLNSNDSVAIFYTANTAVEARRVEYLHYCNYIKSMSGTLVSYNEWSKSITKLGECLFVPIYTVVYRSDITKVADFVTRSKTHSFVTESAFVTHNCGVRKFLSISSDVSREVSSDDVIRELYPRLAAAGITIYAPSEWEQVGDQFWPLYVNGIPLGYTTENALDIVRQWRRSAEHMGLATISAYVKRRIIAGFNQKELHVASTPNRMVRPLHICYPIDPTQTESPMALAIDIEGRRLTNEARLKDKNALEVNLWKAKWSDLVWKYHVIEYLDKREEETYSQTTAWYPWELMNGEGTKYQHCEINPMFSLGYNAASMPFDDHQQGTRTGYGANQLKHVVGVPSSMYATRFETTTKVLHHPQRPITTTEAFKAAGFYSLPTGTNAMVAIMTGASNIEDAIIMNRASTERGMFNTTTFATVKVMNAPGEFDAPAVPDKRILAKPRQPAHLGTKVVRSTAPKIVPGSYKHLEKAYPTQEQIEEAKRIEEETGTKIKLPTAHPAGIVPVGTHVQTGDILAAKIRPEAPGVAEFKQTLKHTRSGRVDAIQMVEGRAGLGVKIRIAFPNVPEVGDKFASIESQKGLLGELRDAVDMPWSENGEIPDVIMNPHGFPSRQTLSYIMEAMYGRAVIGAPRVSVLPGSALRGAQPYNRTYMLKDLDEGFVRPNLTVLWMKQYNNSELRAMRRLYARDVGDEYKKRVVNTNKVSGFLLKHVGDGVRQQIVENANDVVGKLLYSDKKRLYVSIVDIPDLKLNALKKIFSAEMVEAVQANRAVDSIKDVARTDLEEVDEEIINVLYGEKEYVYVGDLPDETRRKFDVQIRKAVLEYKVDDGYWDLVWDEDKIDKVRLDQLKESGIEGAEELVDEIESTIEGEEGVSSVQGAIEELFVAYKKSKDYVEVKTNAGVIAKRVPLSLIKKKDRELYDRLVGRYGDSFVPIVDVVSVKDKSKVASERLERMGLERARTESVKERAQNATASNKTIEVEDMVEFLESIGWKDGGEEVFRDGKTGEELRCRIFTGPVMYHTMTQMATDKIQSRAKTGAISAATRRPTGGRTAAGGGGGKFEEMAAMAAISHSAVGVIHARLTEDSVMMREAQCKNCGAACVRGTVDEAQCTFCGAVGAMVRTELPYPSRKLKAILTTMGINMSFGGDVSIRDTKLYSERPRLLREEVNDDVADEEREGGEEEPEYWG